MLPSFYLMSSFPDFKTQGFDLEAYNEQFRNKNILINAESTQVSYTKHWGPLSIKTAYGGNEYYSFHNCDFAVNDKNYLIINDGTFYSSFIDSSRVVESFTINFSEEIVRNAQTSWKCTPEYLLDNFNHLRNRSCIFYEKLNPHDNIVSPYIFKLRKLAKNFAFNMLAIEETYLLLLESLLNKQGRLDEEMNSINAIKLSTKKEIYKRLTRAKDFIDSCFYKDITLSDLSRIAFMNETYFLRHFRNFFGVTPRQYLIQQRMSAARELLETQRDLLITDVCIRVGYNDLSSFSKLFKSFYSLSPENYKQRSLVKFKLVREKNVFI